MSPPWIVRADRVEAHAFEIAEAFDRENLAKAHSRTTTDRRVAEEGKNAALASAARISR